MIKNEKITLLLQHTYLESVDDWKVRLSRLVQGVSLLTKLLGGGARAGHFLGDSLGGLDLRLWRRQIQ
jgi:hypothetical protein